MKLYRKVVFYYAKITLCNTSALFELNKTQELSKTQYHCQDQGPRIMPCIDTMLSSVWLSGGRITENYW